jgi:hypothetical protein
MEQFNVGDRMAKPAIMELGNRGVITDPNVILSKAYVHGFLADQSQSILHSDKVISFQYLAAMYGSDPTQFAEVLEERLRDYYLRFFPESVEVAVNEKDPGKNIQYTLNIGVKVISEGKVYQLNTALYRDNNSDITRLEKAII